MGNASNVQQGRRHLRMGPLAMTALLELTQLQEPANAQRVRAMPTPWKEQNRARHVPQASRAATVGVLLATPVQLVLSEAATQHLVLHAMLVKPQALTKHHARSVQLVNTLAQAPRTVRHALQGNSLVFRLKRALHARWVALQVRLVVPVVQHVPRASMLVEKEKATAQSAKQGACQQRVRANARSATVPTVCSVQLARCTPLGDVLFAKLARRLQVATATVPLVLLADSVTPKVLVYANNVLLDTMQTVQDPWSAKPVMRASLLVQLQCRVLPVLEVTMLDKVRTLALNVQKGRLLGHRLALARHARQADSQTLLV
jgi:hypothetical protein